MTTQIKLRRDTGANWTTNSTVVLGEGEIGVNLTNGQFKLGDGTSTWAALTYFQPGSGGTGDRLVNGLNEVVLNSDGSLSIGNNTVHISTNGYITAVANVNTVIYTATVSDLGSIRVHATIEGQEVGDTTGYHTQACDMMIVRRISTLGVSTVDSVVYGVIYTGAGPLATLDAQWNAVTSKIEITATPVSTTNNVYVKIYATEVARGD
jgi:hypothetical protein